MNDFLTRKTLIIDDNEFDRFIHRKLLSHHRISEEIVECNGGREALRYMQNLESEPLPDLILLDLMMPEMDGFQFLSHYQQLLAKVSEYPRLFMISSTENDTDLKRARQNEFVIKMLHKPLAPETLMRYLQALQEGKEV